MNKHLFVTLLLALLHSFPLYAESLTFLTEGKTVKVLDDKELKQLVGLTTLQVDNVTDSRIAAYEGASLAALLNAVYGPLWQNYDAVKFTARDGYQPIIPSRIVKQHSGFIALHEVGQTGFTPILRENGERIDPGPYYVIWENIRDTAAKKDAWLSWPWQLTGIELTQFSREFPLASPPPDSNAEVTQGFLHFQQHCSKCHSINGEGSNIGPELNFPVNVTEYWQPDWLAKFIADPQSVRAGSKMVPFYRDVDNRKAVVAQVIAYLRVMVQRKIAPGQ